MPTYEYACAACGHEFEEFQSITAKPLKKCPQCKKNKLDRLIGTGAGVLFKGSGFYETDYRSESYKKAAEAEKKSTEGKSEAKDGADGASKASDTPKSEPSAGKSKQTSSKNRPGDAGKQHGAA